MGVDLDLSFRGIWPRLFVRLGGLSLLADGEEGVLELNGRPVRWFDRTTGRTIPLDRLGTDTQLEVSPDRRLAAMGQVLRRFAEGRPTSPVELSLKLLGLLAGLWALLAAGTGLQGGAWWAWGPAWDARIWGYLALYIAAGLLLQVVGAQLRGLSAIAYAFIWFFCLAGLGHPGYGALAMPVIFLLALSRFLNPWLGPAAGLLFVARSSGEGILLLAPWLGMAAILTLMEALKRSRALQLPAEPGFQDLVRGAEALAGTRVWSQTGEDRPLTDVAVWKAEGVTLPGGAPLWVIENGAESLTLLPGALLWAREGIRARLIPWTEVHLLGQPCAWRNAPKTVKLGAEQWLLTLWIPGARPWSLLVADATWGRRCSQAWGRFMTEPTDEAPEPPTPPPGRRREDVDLFDAYRTLGLHPGITPEQVRRAFHELARQHHPDAHPDATPEERARLEARMQALNEAYAKLKEEGAA